MLILHGERDYQVTPEEFARWKAALGSRRDVTFHSYPALNHLFIAGTGASLIAPHGLSESSVPVASQSSDIQDNLDASRLNETSR